MKCVRVKHNGQVLSWNRFRDNEGNRVEPSDEDDRRDNRRDDRGYGRRNDRRDDRGYERRGDRRNRRDTSGSRYERRTDRD